mgnify:CR=1 FL=1
MASRAFALVRGELHAESGDFARPADLRVASVAQEVPALTSSAIDYVIDGDTELRRCRQPFSAPMLLTTAR